MRIKNVIAIAIIILPVIGSLTTNEITYGADSLARTCAARTENAGTGDKSIKMSAEVLRDKIRGGLLGQLLGNLNGLEHEMQYINEPGNVEEYTPALSEGAYTDDDTDLEWVYIVAMQHDNTIMLPPHLIVQLWRERINKRIWCSNQYARQLMDIGFEPPPAP